jgi:hypothetical protein
VAGKATSVAVCDGFDVGSFEIQLEKQYDFCTFA